MRKVVEGLDPCEDCGAPWMDEGDGTPTQTHTDKCWTAPKAGEVDRRRVSTSQEFIDWLNDPEVQNSVDIG